MEGLEVQEEEGLAVELLPLVLEQQEDMEMQTTEEEEDSSSREGKDGREREK